MPRAKPKAATSLLSTETQLVEVDELTIHPENPRRGDLAQIKRSMMAHGFWGALVVQRSTGHVLAGNHRLMAARELGVKRVPVCWVDVDDVKARAILVADNRTSDLGSYDDEMLAALLGDLKAHGELEGTGYEADEVDELLAALEPVEDAAWDGAAKRLTSAEPDEATITLKIPFHLRDQVLARLGKYGATPSEAVCALLGVGWARRI